MSQICPKCRSLFDATAEVCPDDEARLIEDLTGSMLAERYLLERFIGIGGMRAPVWRGQQTSTRRTVAIKLMAQREGRPAERFEREARIASNLNHRHIVVVHEYGTDERDQLYLVMEFLHGISLRRVLRTGHPLPMERVLHISEQVLRALEHAHKHNVVHRDLKPDNMMLTTQDDDPDFMKILDFGIAKYYASEPDEEKPGLAPDSHELTQDSVLCGTPLYMAPEQITGESFDARIDLYALGIVMYQMITGRVPFTGKTSYEILSKQIGEAPPLFREVRPELDVPAALEDVVLRSLEKDPGLRFQTAREMRLALRDVRRAVGVITQDTDEPSWAGPLPTPPAAPVRSRRGGAIAASPAGAASTLDPVPADHLTRTIHPPAHVKGAKGRSRGGLWIGLAILLAVGAGVGLGLALSGGGEAAPTGAVVQDAPPGPGEATKEAVEAGGGEVDEAQAAIAVPTVDDDEIVELNLQPEPEGEVAADGASAGSPDAGVGGAEDTAPAAAVATLAVTATPVGATVELDGEAMGKAPLKLALTEGAHAVLVQAPGHGDELIELTVSAEQLGQALERAVLLTPEPEVPSADAPAAAKRGPRGELDSGAGIKTNRAPDAAPAADAPADPAAGGDEVKPAAEGDEAEPAGGAEVKPAAGEEREPAIELLDGSKRRPKARRPRKKRKPAATKKPAAVKKPTTEKKPAEKKPRKVKVEILE